MRIRRLRKARKLTQVDLARRVRVGQAYISKLETGIPPINPSLRVVRRLASALDVPVSHLLGE